MNESVDCWCSTWKRVLCAPQCVCMRVGGCLCHEPGNDDGRYGSCVECGAEFLRGSMSNLCLDCKELFWSVEYV